MSNKPILIVSIIAAIVVVGVIGMAVFLRSTPPSPRVAVVVDQLLTSTEQNVPVCPEVPEDKRIVRISVVEAQDIVPLPSGKQNQIGYRVTLDSSFPVNVAKVALTYDPKSLKFERIDSSTSLFPIEAPGEVSAGLVVSSRGISGQSAGLVGTGEFGDFVFTDIRSKKQTTMIPPIIDIEKSVIYLNNGCAARATLRIMN